MLFLTLTTIQTSLDPSRLLVLPDYSRLCHMTSRSRALPLLQTNNNIIYLCPANPNLSQSLSTYSSYNIYHDCICFFHFFHQSRPCQYLLKLKLLPSRPDLRCSQLLPSIFFCICGYSLFLISLFFYLFLFSQSFFFSSTLFLIFVQICHMLMLLFNTLKGLFYFSKLLPNSIILNFPQFSILALSSLTLLLLLIHYLLCQIHFLAQQENLLLMKTSAL